MRIFEDTAQEIDERSSERMNFRTKPRVKAAIQQGRSPLRGGRLRLYNERSL